MIRVWAKVRVSIWFNIYGKSLGLGKFAQVLVGLYLSWGVWTVSAISNGMGERSSGMDIPYRSNLKPIPLELAPTIRIDQDKFIPTSICAN